MDATRELDLPINRCKGKPAFAPPEILKEKVANGEQDRKSERRFCFWNPDGTHA